MKTLELRNLNKTIHNEYIVYKSSAYRWDDGISHPIRENESIHTSRELAEAEADNMELSLGFVSIVDSYTIATNKIEDDRVEISISDIAEWEHHGADWRKRNNGEKLNPDGVLVGYTHVKYINYAYNVNEVLYVRDSDFINEADLINESDCTTTTYYVYYPNENELAIEFENRCSVPFRKMISGNKLIKEFLK